ncbi:hypothetical protein D3C77_599840 [compost metagenome]
MPPLDLVSHRHSVGLLFGQAKSLDGGLVLKVRVFVGIAKLLFAALVLKAVVQHCSGVIERLSTDLGDWLDAPFIKGLHRNPEAFGHAFFVQPERLSGNRWICHGLNNNQPPKKGHT